jgi:FkbM family methyltransferase
MNQHPFQLILGLEKLVLADVGASYFLQDTWNILAGLESTTFVLFDPNGENLSYTQAYPLPSFITIPCALSQQGGLRTLYLSNTDSGSSLYPPINRTWERSPDHPYYFPMRLVEMETQTLAQSLDHAHVPVIDAIKLDTQGTELEIVRGLDEARWQSLLLVEMEVGLQNPLPHEGAARLCEVQEELEARGFTLANIRTSRTQPSTQVGISIPNECDVLFIREPHQLAKHQDCHRLARKMVALACAYYLHDLAKLLISPLWRSTLGFNDHECSMIEVAIQSIADAQANYIAQGGLSLWHRDAG